MATDYRFVKFREDYTTSEHLLSLHEDLAVLRTDSARTSCELVRRIGQRDDEVASIQWEIERDFEALIESNSEIAAAIEEGFATLTGSMHWGFSRVAQELELSRQVYLDIRDLIKYPKATQGAEFREWAEKDIKNQRWDDAVESLSSAINCNKRDFLAHFHLGHVFWFRFGLWNEALHEFRQAALYSDEVGCSKDQAYYAATSYIHQSLLHRMDVGGPTGRGELALREALKASTRALALRGDLLSVRLEHTLNCLRLGDQETPVRLIREDARTSKSRLVSYLKNPDLRRIPDVHNWVDVAGCEIEDVEEEHNRLFAEADAENRRVAEERKARNAASAAARLKQGEQKQEEQRQLNRRLRIAVFVICFVGVVVGIIWLASK